MINYTKDLYADMQKQLQQIRMINDEEQVKAIQSFHIVETCMIRLKEYISKYSFKNKEEEIDFFKIVKPSFHRELIYLVELIHIEANRPMGCSKDIVISYYRQVSDRLNLFFSQHHLMYLYYRTKRSNEDDLLFLRETDCIPMLPEDSCDLDTVFSTVNSSKFAKFQAFEMVIDYLAKAIDGLENGKPEEIHKHKASWTAPLAALTELGLAIYANGSVNFGQASLKLIMGTLEEAFHVKLGNFYRVTQAMDCRKGSRTTYLDLSKTNVNKYFDEKQSQ